MRKKWMWVFLCVAIGGGAACSGPSRTMSEEARVAERFQMHSGSLLEVAMVGDDPIVVLWNDANGTRVFWISTETVVSRDGAGAALTDLRVGDEVQVWTVYGSEVATEVVCGSP